MTKFYEIIKRPIITEKTTKLAENGVCTFEVDKKANKIEIANAIEAPTCPVPTIITLCDICPPFFILF